MKTLYIAMIALVGISVIVLCPSQAFGIPYVSPPARYFNSDVVLIGKVISSMPFSADYTKYEIKVEQYLKNPQSQDIITVIAAGTNKTEMTADTVFDVGQRAFLYLKKDQGNYTVWWYSYPTDSMCDPAPTATDMNFTQPHGAGLDYNPLQVGASKSSSYLYVINQPVVIQYNAWSNQLTTKTFDVVFQVKNQTGYTIFNDTKPVELKPCIGHQIVNSTFVPKVPGTYEVDVIFNNSLTGTTVEIPDLATNTGLGIVSPLKQFRLGVLPENIQCNTNLVLIFKMENNSPACVRPQTAQKLVEHGWAKNQANDGTLITLGEGQREGPLLVQKILSDSIQGLDFREYPLATNVGYPITLHIGDSASNGCTEELTLVKIGNSTATFLKSEHFNRNCPICLSENTVIDTPNGPINVKKLTVGMTVFTQDSSGLKQTATILKTGRTLSPPGHMMVHVVLDDKRELYVSPNHPTSDGRVFYELMVGNILDGSQIKNIEQVPYNGTFTYDILPNGPTGFYWADGILVGSTLK